MKIKNNYLLSSINNKKILITGAAGNLGSMMSYFLGALGARLILIDNSKSKINILRKKLLDEKINFNIYHCDLEIENERKILIKKLHKKFKNLDILINNAGFVGNNKLEGWNTIFEKQSLKTWRRAIEVNLTSPFHLIQSLKKMLENSKNSSVINISSIYGELGPKWHLYEDSNMGNPAAYAASKGGLAQLTRWLAVTLAPNIRVNSICLGGVFNNQPKTFIKKYEDEVPLNRMADKEDLLGAIILLSSDMSNYITGQSIVVDGGWSSW